MTRPLIKNREEEIKLKIVLNKNQSQVDAVREALKENEGYCPCRLVKTEDSKCMCKEFREQETPGLCHCGLHEKVID